MTNLFQQLGLPSDEQAIAEFIRTHQLNIEVAIGDAPFWTPVQAQFLRDEIAEDADWAETVDQLNVLLRR